jgi:hypothetical protein
MTQAVYTRVLLVAIATLATLLAVLPPHPLLRPGGPRPPG